MRRVPGGEEGYALTGWVLAFPEDPGQAKYKLDEVLAAEALLLGRVTHEGFAAAWPSQTDEAGFADKMNSMPKYVVSSTLDDLEWQNSTLVRGWADTIRLKLVDSKVFESGVAVYTYHPAQEPGPS